MRRFKTVLAVVVAVGWATYGHSQQTLGDDSRVFQEFAKLRQVYQQQPLQLSIHLQSTASPITSASDTLQTNMDFFYDKSGFYMRAEGLEEIVNDSLIVMVNKPVKQIAVYSNNHPVATIMEKSTSLFMVDSSLEKLSKLYTSSLRSVDGANTRIELVSRETFFGTNLPKESIMVVYRSSSHEPVEFNRTQTRLLPVDSTVYRELVKKPEYSGKLFANQANEGHLYFLAKTSTTKYRFKKIDRSIQAVHAGEQDRVIKSKNGEYLPAKGLEDYTVSKNF